MEAAKSATKDFSLKTELAKNQIPIAINLS